MIMHSSLSAVVFFEITKHHLSSCHFLHRSSDVSCRLEEHIFKVSIVNASGAICLAIEGPTMKDLP
jgi:hypothetical protein